MKISKSSEYLRFVLPFVTAAVAAAEEEADAAHPKRQTPGSNAFVPAVAGLILAGEVIKDLSGVGTK